MAYDLSPEARLAINDCSFSFPITGWMACVAIQQANLYITRYGKGSIAIVSPTGELIREVQMKGKKTSNIAFGGPDGKTAYVTLQDRGCLESFQGEYPGREWSWRKK